MNTDERRGTKGPSEVPDHRLGCLGSTGIHHEDSKDLKPRSRNRSQLFADVAVVEILANREEFTVSEYEGIVTSELRCCSREKSRNAHSVPS